MINVARQSFPHLERHMSRTMRYAVLTMAVVAASACSNSLTEPTPTPALTRALELKPRSVVFISDGHFDKKAYDGIEAHVASLNREAKAHVHTVGFFSNDDEDDSRDFFEFMKRLAER